MLIFVCVAREAQLHDRGRCNCVRLNLLYCGFRAKMLFEVFEIVDGVFLCEFLN